MRLGRFGFEARERVPADFEALGGEDRDERDARAGGGGSGLGEEGAAATRSSAPESSRTNAISSALNRRCTGTMTAPRASAA
nr:hypothetical protein GCM10025732_58400 [Glycomyces mayteni]